MLLLDQGVPSTLRRSAGFDVPDFLAAGPRDVLVPESGLEPAREVLLAGGHLRSPAWRRQGRRPVSGARRRSCCSGILLGATALGILTTIVVIVQGN